MCHVATIPAQERSSLRRADFRQHLEDICRFWLRARDEENGGFSYYIGSSGKRYPRSHKYSSLLINSRLLYNYAEGIRAGLEFCEEPAAYLYDHIMGPLRAEEGWHFSMRYDRCSPRTGFDTYDNLYVVIALARYAQATGRQDLLDQAWELMGLIEDCVVEGDLPTAGVYGRWSTDDDDAWVMSRYSGNTNLHYLEALGVLRDAGLEQDLEPRVRAMREFVLGRVWDEQRGLVHDHFHDSFANPYLGPGAKTSLAHGLEWMAFFRLFAGCELPEQVERRILSMALEHGVLEDGCFQDTFFFPEGRTAGPAQFWTQTEAVVGFNVARRVYGREYEEPLMSLAGYYMDRFVDDEVGGVNSEIDPNGVVTSRKKGNYWKADYHSVRMCVDIMYGDGDWFDG